MFCVCFVSSLPRLQTSKLGSLVEVSQLPCAESIRDFYFLVQDIRCFVLSLISLHFKISPYSAK